MLSTKVRAEGGEGEWRKWRAELGDKADLHLPSQIRRHPVDDFSSLVISET